MSVLSPVIGSLDTTNKLIYLDTGIREYHPVDDIYKEIRNLRRTNENLRKFDIMVSAKGAEPKGGGKYTSRYAVFNHGWRVVPEDVSHSLYISGEQLTDDGQSGPACLDTDVLSAGTSVIIHYEPPASELVKAADEIAAIKRMAFDEKVAVDPLNTTGNNTTSIEFPAGTRQKPAANLSTALAIAAIESYGFKKLFLESSLDATGSFDLNGFLIEGNNHVETELTIATEVLAENLRIEFCSITDTVLDGNVAIHNCIVSNISYLNGHIHSSGVGGYIILGGNRECVIESCFTIDADNPVHIDMGGSGNDLAMPNYSGIVYIGNLTSVTEEIGIGMNAGLVILEDTITAGNITIAGNGILIDNSGPNAIVNSDALTNNTSIAESVWSYERT